jgi:hypothetical protein
MRSIIEKSEPVRGDRFSLDFEQRTARLTEELPPFAVRQPALPLGNLAHHPNRRTAHL